MDINNFGLLDEYILFSEVFEENKTNDYRISFKKRNDILKNNLVILYPYFSYDSFLSKFQLFTKLSMENYV